MCLTTTRPDTMYYVSLVSRYMECPKKIHFAAAKRILRYVQRTIDCWFTREDTNKIFVVLLIVIMPETKMT